jgi:hypothetical protein
MQLVKNVAEAMWNSLQVIMFPMSEIMNIVSATVYNPCEIINPQYTEPP